MAKSLYSALFDWIVLRINHALLNKKDMEESVSVSPPPQPHRPASLGWGGRALTGTVTGHGLWCQEPRQL